MTQETSTIQLPPPRKNDSKPRARRGVWMLWVFAALVSGLAGGIFAGKYLAAKQTVVVRTTPTRVEVPAPAPAVPMTSPEIEEKLARAAAAVTEGDWLAGQSLYQEILSQEPEHSVALAALPLIERHLASARSLVKIETTPPGAMVKLGTLGEKVSPAVFEDVPFGVYPLEVSHEGFQAHQQKITVSQPSVDLAGIELSRSAGVLKLSSVPEGVEFKLLRTDGLEELVHMGKTPATLEQLDEGDYQVLMALNGWPEYREKVKVETNRNASVSHIFGRGGLKITSDPSEAEVWLTTDASLPAKKLGITPLSASELPVGRHRLELRYRDWQPIQRTVEVREGEAIDLDFAWKRGAVAFVSDPPGATVRLSDNPSAIAPNSVSPFTAEFPEGTYTFVAQYPELEPVMVSVDVKGDETTEAAFNFDYGSVSIDSQPPGATVVSNGTPIGRTPYKARIVKPGPKSFEVTLAQHRSTTFSGEVKPGQSLNFDARLVFDPTPKTQSDFPNSQGIQMVWIDALHGWVGAHEVTQKAFSAVMNKNPSDFVGDTLPVQGVSWYEASRFCEQLTSSERSSGRLPRGYRYSLPSDQMWSFFAGSTGLDNAVTSQQSRREGPAPVGSLKPNEFGLYDVRGNVWEWCDDWYSLDIVNRSREAQVSTNSNWVGTERKVLRGGSWNRSSGDGLESAYRYAIRPSTANYEVGFRVVLMPE
ncbi:MAG: PEGA domain-containing protein [Verrucomicrobiae bacterium]|nr:PEGA domain-containing protein [Verrucomicrobiae bacterium]